MPDEPNAIAPALTSEEWSECVVTLGENSRLHYKPGVAVIVQARGVAEPMVKFAGERAVQLMALANAALSDSDPRKITRADIRILREQIAEHEGTAKAIVSHGQPLLAGAHAQSAQLLRDLADKLAALLPPE